MKHIELVEPHAYISPIKGDPTLGCAICSYSFDAIHHKQESNMADIDATDNHMGRPAAHEFEFASSGPGDNSYCKCGMDISSKIHLTKKEPEGIGEEAKRIVYGDREKAYDDPNRNFKKLAFMWTGTLMEKLRPDVVLTPNDVALCLEQLKISRESFQPNRENRVDGIGYWHCLDRIVTEQEKEKKNAAS